MEPTGGTLLLLRASITATAVPRLTALWVAIFTVHLPYMATLMALCGPGACP
ncbi:MAG: hypothetical protein ACP5P4_06915 [Steroidobacteraceae bacterium]